jgi:hypothetical protein
LSLTPRDSAKSDSGVEGKGLDDPRALDILTTEHWSLLSTRALGYQEMFSRATIFIAIVSGTIVALALLAQATGFSSDTLWLALLLISVDLFIGVTTFIRLVAINFEDARWVMGMNLLRDAYMKIVPGVEPFFVTSRGMTADAQALAHGSPQRLSNLGNSLTTTSSTVATMNSVLAGSLTSDVAALSGGSLYLNVGLGAVVSLISGALHVRHAAKFRERHPPSSRT